MKTTRLIYAIDDNPDYRLLVSQVFRQDLATYELRFFESGDALVYHLFRGLERPGLVLLDRHMPGRDGHRTLELIKKHPDWQIVPVVMLSSHASPRKSKTATGPGPIRSYTSPWSWMGCGSCCAPCVTTG